MPRRRSPPRLYLDKARRQWIIRDGTTRIRTGCAEADRGKAEKLLAEYIGEKHQPAFGPDPLIADILTVYSREHLQHKISAPNYAYNVAILANWWGDKSLSDVTPANTRAYCEGRTDAAVRHDLEILRAAIRYWHKHHGPLPLVPQIILPPKPEPRERWMTRSEAAKLLRAARSTSTRGRPSVARFILLGLSYRQPFRRDPESALGLDRLRYRYDAPTWSACRRNEEQAGTDREARSAHPGASTALAPA